MQSSSTQPKGNLTFAKFFKNIFICYALTIILLTILAVIVTYLPVSEGIVPVVVLLITIASVAASGFSAAKNAYTKGWLYGAVTGFIYIITLFLLGSLVFGEFYIGAEFFSMLLIGILSGTVGGIIGVNVRQ